MLKFSNLDFNGKIVAKFILRSHFFSIYNNTTIKQQINRGTTQNVCNLHNGIFYSINMRHTLSILLYHLPCAIH